MTSRIHLLIAVLAAVSVWLTTGVTPALADTITLRFMRHDERVLMTASGAKSAPVLQVSERQVARLRYIFLTLECRVNPKCHWLLPRGVEMPPLLSPDDLRQAMASGGDELFSSFRGELKSARHVVFEIDWSMLKWPLDLLHFDKQPLFLLKVGLLSGWQGQAGFEIPGFERVERPAHFRCHSRSATRHIRYREAFPRSG